MFTVHVATMLFGRTVPSKLQALTIFHFFEEFIFGYAAHMQWVNL